MKELIEYYLQITNNFMPLQKLWPIVLNKLNNINI